MHHPPALGFVGLGDFAQVRAGACRRAGLAFAGCYDPDAGARQRFSQTFPCPTFASFEALCDHPTIDAVVLASPNHHHAWQAQALAAAGKAVFVEKPLCGTLAEADAIISACDQAGVVLAVGHQERRKAVYRDLRQRIRAGDFGRVHSFEANHCGDLLKIWPADNWRFTGDHGPLLHKGIHKIDILVALFGTVIQVATLARSLAINPEMHETTVSILRCANDVMGSLTSGFRYDNATFTIAAERGHVHYSGFGNAYQIRDAATWSTREVICAEGDPLAEEMAEFARAVRGEGAVEVSGEVARTCIAIALAAQQSADRGAFVCPDGVVDDLPLSLPA